MNYIYSLLREGSSQFAAFMNYLIFGSNNCEYTRLRFKFCSGNVPDFPSYGEACEQISQVFLHLYTWIPVFERGTWIPDSNR